MTFLLRIAAAACLGVLSLPAAAERILDYSSLIEIQHDGSLEITEHIRVRAEGRQIRRGIYRDFPTRYRDRFGNRVVVDFEVLEVLRDGQPEPWFTERVANGVRVNTGDDSFLPVPADIRFTLRYRTTRQLGYFSGHDELYFNAIGHGWAFQIERGRAEVRLPEPVPESELNTYVYTGFQGQRGSDADISITAPGTVRFRATRPLAQREGMTVVVEFPKGIVAEPGTAQRIAWFLVDNRGVLIALAGLILVLLFYIRAWMAKGRDPSPGVIFARYDPPEDYSPAGLRYVQRMAYDNRCFGADLVDMAVKGVLRIQHDKKSGMFGKENWKLERRTENGVDLSPSQQVLLEKLFGSHRKTVKLEDSNAELISGARQAQQKAMRKRYQPRYFITNSGTVALGFAFSILTGALAFVVARGDGILPLIAVLAVLALVNIIFIWLMRAPTPEGRKLLDHIEGLKLYLSVAERQDLKRLEHRNEDEPPLDAPRYESLLPYAIALDVEDAWTGKFTAAVGATAATAAAAGIGWYYGSGVAAGNLGSIGNSLGRSFTSQIASSASPPGSSSGGGGGGSSGGGGGGGGGGGR